MSHLIPTPRSKVKWSEPFPSLKRSKLIPVILLLSLLLSACANGSATTVPAESVLAQVDAAVIGTLSAQSTTVAQSASSPTPTAALLATPIAIAYSTSTRIAASSTPTTLYYYASYSNYGCYDAEFIKDVTIPDDTVLSPGETFTKTWKLRNTGSCNWTSDFSIVFLSGDDLDGSDTETGQTVYVNRKAEISVELTAPDDEGTYVGYWQMVDEYGNTFGDTVTVEIVVEEEATSTPTSIPTAIVTATATPTSPSTATPTIMPTETGTTTAVPTSTSTTALGTPTDTPTPVTVDIDTPTPTPVPTDAATATPTETEVG